MAANTTGHWLVAQVASPSMIERRRGAFVFVGSTAAMWSSGRSLSYEATKAAQLAVMRHIAVRYGGHGIRSNAVVLGIIDSPMVRREFGGDDDTARARDLVRHRWGVKVRPRRPPAPPCSWPPTTPAT